jgi:hypothetical protein
VPQNAHDLPKQRPCYPPRPQPLNVQSTSCCGGTCRKNSIVELRRPSN